MLFNMCCTVISRSFSEEESKSSEQLMQIVKYLRREKEILGGKLDLLQSEANRVKGQLDNAQKQLEETKMTLDKERNKSASSLMSSAKYDEMMEKVETLHALSDSNKMLREEKAKLEQRLNSAESDLAKEKAESVPTKAKLKELEESEETRKTEMTALQSDNER